MLRYSVLAWNVFPYHSVSQLLYEGNNASEIMKRQGSEEEEAKKKWKLQNKSNFEKQKSLASPFLFFSVLSPYRQNLFAASWDWMKYAERNMIHNKH